MPETAILNSFVGVPLETRQSRVLLLATGDSELIEYLRAMLGTASDFQYSLVHASGPRMVERQLGRGGIDLLIVDLGTGLGSQADWLARIAELSPGIPVVALCPGPHRHAGVSAVRDGAFAYLLKGTMSAELFCSTVDSAIEHHRHVQAMRCREQRLELAVRSTGQGLWDWDLHRDSVFYSAQWEAILGYPAKEVVDSPRRWYSRVHPDDLPALKRALEVHLSGRRSSLEFEFRMRHVDGAYRWVAIHGLCVADGAGVPVRLGGSIQDIHERKQGEEQAVRNAMHDSLTGLPNRALFLDRVEVALATLKRRPTHGFAVVFMDLDRFKKVNDTFGHKVGDQLLVAVARRLTKFVRPEDTVARLCGDEFAVLLAEAADAKVAMAVARRIQQAFEQDFLVEGQRVRVQASLGVALSSTGYGDVREILNDADVAMYRSKADGGGRCRLFDAELHRTALALLQMEGELRTAVERSSFVMHYQPVVTLDNARIVGFEALVRWQHPERGLVTPAQFLAVAEASGLVVPIGWWAIENACRQMAVWLRAFRDQQPLWVSINVSGKLFSQADMVSNLSRILERTGLPPHCLLLELAEGVVADHGGGAVARLEQLRELGVKLSVDDFGAGFASLGLLDQFKFDALKIDPACLAPLNSGQATAQLLETILALARSLGVKVTAEGVETEVQADYLRRSACPEGQGFWFCRPVDVATAERLLENGLLH